MPLFGGGSTQFDHDVEKITNERNTSEDWGLIMDFCDRVSTARDGPKDCLKAITKRLFHQDPHVVMQAIVLLDACVNNCGKPFKLQVASREFESDFKKLLAKSHPKVKEKLKAMLKKWAEQEFEGDHQLSLIPSLYNQLRREGEDFSHSDQGSMSDLQDDAYVGSSYSHNQKRAPRTQAAQKLKGAFKTTKDTIGSMIGGNKTRSGSQRSNANSYAYDNTPVTYQQAQQSSGPANTLRNEFEEPRRQQGQREQNAVANQQEEEDIAKAIKLSLQDKGGRTTTNGQSQPQGGGSSLYGNLQEAMASTSTTEGFKEPKKARALYDFEAAEDNELTFTAGEVVIILDDSDENWWKGSNHRGEGLFPSNFVTTELDGDAPKEEKRRRSVQFNEEVEVKTLDQSQHSTEQEELKRTNLGPVTIDEAQIDRILNLLNDSDPTTEMHDDPNLQPLEEHVNQMGPLIDAELEQVDRRLAQLTRLSTELVDALNLYHQLMKELPSAAPMNVNMHPYGAMLPQQPQQPQPMYYAPPVGMPQVPGAPMAAPAVAAANTGHVPVGQVGGTVPSHGMAPPAAGNASMVPPVAGNAPIAPPVTGSASMVPPSGAAGAPPATVAPHQVGSAPMSTSTVGAAPMSGQAAVGAVAAPAMAPAATNGDQVQGSYMWQSPPHAMTGYNSMVTGNAGVGPQPQALGPPGGAQQGGYGFPSLGAPGAPPTQS